jgi:hypothetical protein
MTVPETPPADALGRREALLAAAGAGAALALAACGADDGNGDGSTDQLGSELDTLAELAALERRAVITYDTGARFSSQRRASELGVLSRQSATHVGALEQMILAAGGTQPSSAPADVLTFIRDQDSAVLAGTQIGERLVHAYTDAIPFDSSVERRRQLTTMLANDAQHLVMLGGVAAAKTLPGGPIDGF